MKTNKDLNKEHQAKQDARVRPKGPTYNFEPLEQVIRQWVKASQTREQT